MCIQFFNLYTITGFRFNFAPPFPGGAFYANTLPSF